MPKTNVHVIEVVPDEELRKKQVRAGKVLKRFFPNAGDLRLYRTSVGEIGIQVDLDFKPGDRQRLDKAYDEIMKVLGEKRGRPRGVRKNSNKAKSPGAGISFIEARCSKIKFDNVRPGRRFGIQT